MIWNWFVGGFRLIGGLSVFSLLMLRQRRVFTRILSDTSRALSEAWGRSLKPIAPDILVGVHRPVTIILDRSRISLGIQELIPLLELVRLCNATRVLEIGTSSGGTTWHLAANMAPHGKVVTVDLPPALHGPAYSARALATERPPEQQLGRYFRGTPEEDRIRQILTDSRQLAHIGFDQKFDVVFIDGAHTYDYVKSDTETALTFVKTGGYIVWHDYFVFHPDYGVRRYLHRLSEDLPIHRLAHSLCAVACIGERPKTSVKQQTATECAGAMGRK